MPSEDSDHYANVQIDLRCEYIHVLFLTWWFIVCDNSCVVLQCLCPLFVCDGWEITTVEGLGSTRNGMHQIQQTLANFGGTQCGYCSPGHVMNMYG